MKNLEKKKRNVWKSIVIIIVIAVAISGVIKHCDKLEKESYDKGYKTGEKAGYDKGYAVGVQDGQSGTSAMFNLFGAVVSVPVNILNGLSPLVIWDTPVISIILTFVFIGVLLFIIKRFI